MRRDSTLANLTPDQLDELYEWIITDTYANVVKRVAEPAPVGFGIKTHITTLCRFYTDERERRHAEALISARSPNSTPKASAEDLTAEANRQLAHATYEISRSPLNPSTFNNLSRALHRKETIDLRRTQIEINQQQLALTQERLELERKRLDLEVKEFEFHAVEEAAKHAVKLKEISSDPSLSDREKYSLARNVLFGPTNNNGRNRQPVQTTPEGIASPQPENL